MNGAISGTGFSGSSSLVTAGGNGSYQNQSGTVDGQFYGAQAGEVAGNIGITGNKVNVGGTFTGKKQ